MSSKRVRTASNARTETGPTAPRRRKDGRGTEGEAAKAGAATRARAGAGTDLEASVEMPDRLRNLDAGQRQAVERYLGELQVAAGLVHWELTLDWDELCADDCDAQVSTVDGRYTAVLWLHDRFFTLPLAEQRRVLVHELLHMHTSAVITAARLGMKNLTKDTRSWVMGYVRDAEEHSVDALSRVLGEHLPMPPWREPSQGRTGA